MACEEPSSASIPMACCAYEVHDNSIGRYIGETLRKLQAAIQECVKAGKPIRPTGNPAAPR